MRIVVIILLQLILASGCNNLDIRQAGVDYNKLSPIYGEEQIRQDWQRYDSEPDIVYSINFSDKLNSNLSINRGTNGYYLSQKLYQTEDFSTNIEISNKQGGVAGIMFRIPFSGD